MSRPDARPRAQVVTLKTLDLLGDVGAVGQDPFTPVQIQQLRSELTETLIAKVELADQLIVIAEMVDEGAQRDQLIKRYRREQQFIRDLLAEREADESR